MFDIPDMDKKITNPSLNAFVKGIIMKVKSNTSTLDEVLKGIEQYFIIKKHILINVLVQFENFESESSIKQLRKLMKKLSV